MNQKIASNRIVNAVIKDARGELITRPAIITRTWGETATSVQATIFPDASNDGLGNTLGKSSLAYDEAGNAENTWHWPVRELPLAAKLEARPAVDWVGIHAASLELCYAIERLPASGAATNASLMAASLRDLIRQAAAPR